MSARADWLANYREHRKAEKLWSSMPRKHETNGVPSFVTAVPGWESFDYCRKWGDRLGVFPMRNALAHQCRMHELSRRVRLPA